jgi:hypothetical protein
MTGGASFRHQDYFAPRPLDLCQWERACANPSEDECRRRMARAATRLRDAGVAAIYLIHGTFAGDDPLALARDLERLSAPAARFLRAVQKRTTDYLLEEVGNYTPDFARRLEELLNPPGSGPRLQVRRFFWSSENHHLGRMDGALRLVEELASGHERGRRVMLWGHSHAGNLLALFTNLLNADEQQRQRVLHAARSFVRWPGIQVVDQPHWERAMEKLRDERSSLREMRFDLATFGTPIRYGWALNENVRLLHFVHHRPCPTLEPHCAKFPPSLRELWHAVYGDFIQQAGIAGTNLLLGWHRIGALIANWRLGELLQARYPSRFLWRYLRSGTRVADAGQSLLVDYPGPYGFPLSHFFGHAVYTQTPWMLFHLERSIDCFYPAETP